jgi:hypothetical protein
MEDTEGDVAKDMQTKSRDFVTRTDNLCRSPQGQASCPAPSRTLDAVIPSDPQ